MNTPIFDQLNVQFAAKGARYEDISKFSTPAFVWGAVSLIKKSSVAVKVEDDETMSLPVVKPIAVTSLRKRGSAA